MLSISKVLLDELLAYGGVLRAVANAVDARREAIDADRIDMTGFAGRLEAVGGLDRRDRAIGLGVVCAVDRVDIRLRGQNVRHHRVGLVGVEAAIGASHDFDVGIFGAPVGKALVRRAAAAIAAMPSSSTTFP